MNHFLHGVMRALSETFVCEGPILEIGAYQVAGQEHSSAICDVPVSVKPYTGLDARSGPGVDCVASVEKLPQADASVGTVIACNTFEHVRCFWRGFEEIHRVLRPDGALLISCPFYFHIHHFPDDYWRFTPAALEVLLEKYPRKIIGWHGPSKRPAHVWAFACREGHDWITDAQFAHYRAPPGDAYAREPNTSWTRGLRYRLARLLCGNGPFAPFLERNHWETVCLNSKTGSAGSRRAA